MGKIKEGLPKDLLIPLRQTGVPNPAQRGICDSLCSGVIPLVKRDVMGKIKGELTKHQLIPLRQTGVPKGTPHLPVLLYLHQKVWKLLRILSDKKAQDTSDNPF